MDVQIKSIEIQAFETKKVRCPFLFGNEARRFALALVAATPPAAGRRGCLCATDNEDGEFRWRAGISPKGERDAWRMKLNVDKLARQWRERKWERLKVAGRVKDSTLRAKSPKGVFTHGRQWRWGIESWRAPLAAYWAKSINPTICWSNSTEKLPPCVCLGFLISRETWQASNPKKYQSRQVWSDKYNVLLVLLRFSLGRSSSWNSKVFKRKMGTAFNLVIFLTCHVSLYFRYYSFTCPQYPTIVASCDTTIASFGF